MDGMERLMCSFHYLVYYFWCSLFAVCIFSGCDQNLGDCNTKREKRTKFSSYTRSVLIHIISTVTRKFPVNSNGWNGEVDVQLSLFGLLLLTQPLHSSEQHTRANLEFSSNFDKVRSIERDTKIHMKWWNILTTFASLNRYFN